MKKTVDNLYRAIRISNEDTEIKELFEDAVKDALGACAEYAKLVSTQEQRIQLARFRMEPDDYREFVMNLDRSRRCHHDALIAKVDMLNRACARFGVDAIAQKISHEDRETYGQFALQVVNEYFDGHDEVCSETAANL